MIIDRMLNRLSHINPAIVMGASKVMLKFSKALESPKIVEGLCRKIAGSLVAIMGRSPEIVWVFLRSLEIMVAKYPGVVNNPKAFFVNFTDPGFVKMQKVQILGRLADEANAKMIITELTEYSYDTNVEFSTFAFQNLWRVGSKVEAVLEPVTKAIHQILFNAQDVGFIDHLLNEAAIAVEVLLRRYQNHALLADIHSFVLKSHGRITRPEAICAMLNMLPEFPKYADDNFAILQDHIDRYLELSSDVQLACLTTAARMFILSTDRYQKLVLKLFDTIDKNVENLDLRDRAFVYWRLLVSNPEVARAIFEAPKEKIEHSDVNTANKELFEELFDRIGGISATLQDRQFLQDLKQKGDFSVGAVEEEQKPKQKNKEDDILQLDQDDFLAVDSPKDTHGKTPVQQGAASTLGELHSIGSTTTKDDLLYLQFGDFGNMGAKPVNSVPISAPTQAVNLMSDFGDFSKPTTTTTASAVTADDLMSHFDFTKPATQAPSAPIKIINEEARKSYEDNMDKYSSFNLLHLQDTTLNPPSNSTQKIEILSADPIAKLPSAPKLEPDFDFEFEDFSNPATKPKSPPKVEYKNKPPATQVTFQTKGAKGKSNVQIQGAVRRENQLLFVTLIIDNKSNSPLNELTFNLAPNPFGLLLRQTEVDAEIAGGSFLKLDLPIGFDQQLKTADWSNDNNAKFLLEFHCNYDSWSFPVDCWLSNLFVS